MVSNVLWTKVKFMRNLHGVVFNSQITSKSQAEVLKLGIEACADCGLKSERLDALSDKVIDNLIASGKLEKGFDSNIKNKGYATNDDANVQINGENHFEIIATDENLYSAYSKAKSVDKQLCNKLHFAYSDKYGFLNPDIKNIGSGMNVSTLIMLPALSRVNAVYSLPKSNERLGFNIDLVNGESGIYLISTSESLGYSEKQICQLADTYINNVLKCEVDMCKNFAKDEAEVLDKSNRAKAIIDSCVKITTQELYCLVSDILIAINSGLEKNVDKKYLAKLIDCVNDTKSNDKIYLAKLIKQIK